MPVLPDWAELEEVLIETLWNVKMQMVQQFMQFKQY